MIDELYTMRQCENCGATVAAGHPHECGDGFAHKLSEFTRNLSDWTEENERYVLGLQSEEAFLEIVAQYNLMDERVSDIIGNLLDKRLRNKHGRDYCDEMGKLTRDARSTLSYWSAKLNVKYNRLDRLMRAARTVSLVKETQDLPTTARAEIGMIDGDKPVSDEERADKIRERLDKVDQIDPARESSVDAVRQIKTSERHNIPRVSIIRYPDLQFGGIIFAGLCREGEYIEFYRLETIEPKNGDLQESVKFYQGELLRRVRASAREPLAEEKEVEEE